MGIDYWEQKYNPNGKLAREVKELESIQSTYGAQAVQLLSLVAQMNEDGQTKTISYVEDLLENPKYKK